MDKDTQVTIAAVMIIGLGVAWAGLNAKPTTAPAPAPAPVSDTEREGYTAEECDRDYATPVALTRCIAECQDPKQLEKTNTSTTYNPLDFDASCEEQCKHYMEINPRCIEHCYACPDC